MLHSVPRDRSGLLCALLATLLLSGCPRSGAVDSGEARPEEAPAVLGNDDVVEIKVYLEDSLSGSYRVDALGAITYPLLGTVEVAGLTASDLASRIREGLKEGFLKDPHVSVDVVEFNSRQISVIGEVKRPGRYPYRAGLTLVQAIAEAGGTTPRALLSSMQVTRSTAEGGNTNQQRFELPFKDITLGRRPDFPLLPGDVVLVQESAVR